MTTNNSSSIETLKKTLEQQGMDELKDLYKQKGVNSSSSGEVLTALSSGNITEKSLTDIMQKGFDTFKQETGRAMTYGEMRELYG